MRRCQNQEDGAILTGPELRWVRVELCQNQGGSLVWLQQLRCTSEVTHFVFLGGRTVRKFCGKCAADISARGQREGFKVRIEQMANDEGEGDE